MSPVKYRKPQIAQQRQALGLLLVYSSSLKKKALAATVGVRNLGEILAKPTRKRQPLITLAEQKP